ncbi:MAG TPA: hypothetical protein VMU10_12580, partial [Desulfomonilia bacterium]|nr:hypothetical protein [Desulfomonilia bacterium]
DYCPVTIIPITEDIVRHHDLTDVDMHIYDLIDEKRTVERIVRECLEPPFEALSSIVRLMDIGLVEFFPEGAKDMRDISIARSLFLNKIKHVALYVVLILCFLTLILAGHPRITKGFIPREIKTYVDDQRADLARFSGKKKELSATDTNNYAH